MDEVYVGISRCASLCRSTLAVERLLLTPDETFALLGDETRVGILQALWDEFESGRGGNSVPYSKLFDQTAIDDSGNFSYHLQKLIGPFVRKTDDGYEPKQTGTNVMRAVVEGTVIDDPSFGPTPIDSACPICGGAIEIAYWDELMTVSCTECEGRIHGGDGPGHLFGRRRGVCPACLGVIGSCTSGPRTSTSRARPAATCNWGSGSSRTKSSSRATIGTPTTRGWPLDLAGAEPPT